MAKQGLGELLVQEEKISTEQLSKAKDTQRRDGGKLSKALLKLGYIKESELVNSIAEQYQLQVVNLPDFDIEQATLDLVPKEICIKHNVIPVMKSLDTLVVACSDPGNLSIRDDLTFITHSKIELVVASETQILDAINRFHESSNYDEVISDLEGSEHGIEAADTSVMTEAEADDEPIIKFVNLMFSEAMRVRASDIHVEPYEKRFRIRFRIDGVLHEKIQPPSGAAKAVVNRVKILSGLDISEKRRPQDGRIKIRQKGGKEMEFRVSVIPSMAGEKIVMRLLDKSGLGKPMEELGFETDDLELFKSKIKLPVGMVLLTGPTGSGKSTTVYSALHELNTPQVNICTAEDPVEMSIDGINHVQTNSQIDLTFSALLRSFLRQDPDIIFVGEIRDTETAEISFKAASTGHMVMSTLHTNDAPSTIVRLLDMGIAPFLIASTVNLVVAQRLVGRICTTCSTDASVSPEVLRDLGLDDDEINTVRPMSGEGCPDCNQTGISGRVAIHELMPITPAVRESIIRGDAVTELRKIAVKNGMRSLRQNAVLKMKQGLTTVEEVLSSTVKD